MRAESEQKAGQALRQPATSRFFLMLESAQNQLVEQRSLLSQIHILLAPPRLLFHAPAPFLQGASLESLPPMSLTWS